MELLETPAQRGFFIMKQCTKCGLEKDFDSFPRDISRDDGYSYVCKDCKNKIKKAYRDKNKDKIKESNKEYYEKKKDF